MPPSPPLEPCARLLTGIAVLDPQLCVTWLNDALAEALQVGIRPLQGQPIATLFEGPSFAGQAERVLRGEPPVCMRDIIMHTLHGQMHRVDVSLQAIAEGLLLEIHVLAEPVHQQTPLSATLRGFAHEVKNPLAGLRGAAQLLQRRVADAELETLASMVIHEADRLVNLADRLLRHGGRPHVGVVDLHAVLDRVAAIVQSEPRAPQIVYDCDPSLPACTGDADRLQQLLLNLARNAVEAGARTLTVRTRVEYALRLNDRIERTALRIDVIDDGPGVPEALRDTLFHPLVSGRADGTGLGLALARETAIEHGGDLRHTALPQGAMFSLFLPARSGQAHAPSDSPDTDRKP